MEFAESARLDERCPWIRHSPCGEDVRYSGAATLENLSSQQSGTLGELLTVAKLNTLGLAAYMSPEGAPGHDVMVVVDGRPRSVEVKTRQFLRSATTEITRWPVDMETTGDADFFIFIDWM